MARKKRFDASQFPIIDDSTDSDFIYPKEFGRGYIERDWDEYPETYLESPDAIQDIPESEWDARIDQQEAEESSLEHVWRRADNGKVPICLDQNGAGYCWSYSCGSSVMVARAKANQPFVRLNPHSTAAIIKRGRDEGGWCGLSCEFVSQFGMAPEGTPPSGWPIHSRDVSLDTPEMRAVMAQFQVKESFMDLTKKAWDRNISWNKLVSVLLGLNDPCQVDFNWWGHSVCALRVVRVERGSYGLLILNSWKGWGNDGMSILRGGKEKPDGAVAIRSVMAA